VIGTRTNASRAADPRASGQPLLFITVGTEQWPFDRLLQWVERWVVRAGPVARVLVQRGPSAAPGSVESVASMAYDDVMAAIEKAAAVVCHGGTTVLEARRHGHVPIVVPRLRSLGECVDDHQVAYARRLAAAREAHVAESEDSFHELLDRVLVSPGDFRSPERPRQGDAVERFMGLVNGLATSPDTHPEQDAAGRVPVIYIGGMGRSGTTLLERMLGEVAGFHPCGELIFLWERGVVGNERCGCGVPFRSCPFWRAVGEEAFGSWDRVAVEDVLALRQEVDRQRYLPLLARPGRAPRFDRRVARFTTVIERLYRAIREVSGARAIIDSSKHASYAFLLGRAANIDLRVVHLIRDSRGVAHSMTKRVVRPEVDAATTLMPRWPPARTSLHWIVHNAGLDWLARRGTPTLELRYERLIRAPHEELRRVLEFLGHETPTTIDRLLVDGRAVLGAAHTVSGNPARFSTGPVELRLDDAWRTALSRGDRAIVTALTFPFLIRYRDSGLGRA
jgi:UDP-N-acetylglucosamine transferase subunit ALG13